MKVAHLSTAHGAGDTRIMEKEAGSLLRAGWDVVAILAHHTSETIGGIRVVGVPRQKRRLARATVGALRTMLAALREKPDVYHFHDPELIPVGLLLRVLGKKVVYDVHETNSETVEYKTYIPKTIRPLVAWLIRNLELTASKHFSGIVAATPKIGDQFKELQTPRVTVQNFPKLNPELSSAPLRNRSCAAIYAGVISEPRGLMTMVDAMSLLPESLAVHLILAGPMTPAARANAGARPGWKRVKEIGPFRPAALPELLSGARVGLVLFHPMSNHLESYPTKMFDYMAAGLPVIASDFPLWRSIMADHDCGLLVDPLSPTAIANAIEYLLTNEEAAETMGERAREMVWTTYNWETEERKLVAFYDKLLPIAD